MPVKFVPLLVLTASFAHASTAITIATSDFWENGGEYLHVLLHEGEGANAAEAAARLRATQQARCDTKRAGSYTTATTVRASGARPAELDMIDHAQALTKKQQREFFDANQAYYAALREEEAKIAEARGKLARAQGRAARIALNLTLREACANITSLQLAAAEINARLTKKNGLDRDYAYRAFFREYRRVVSDRK